MYAFSGIDAVEDMIINLLPACSSGAVALNNAKGPSTCSLSSCLAYQMETAAHIDPPHLLERFEVVVPWPAESVVRHQARIGDDHVDRADRMPGTEFVHCLRHQR